MNEMELLQRLGTELDPPTGTLPPSLRVRALAQRHTSRRRARQRLAWRLVLAGGLASAVAVGGYLSLPDRVATPGTTTEHRTGAALFLHRAALAAAQEQAPTPRPNQFIFTESVDHYTMQVQQPDGTLKTVDSGPQVRQTWLSVDGTHPSLLRTRPQSDPNGWSEDTLEATPGDGAYRTDLPTDPTAMLRWLYNNSQGQNQRDEQAFITANDLIGGGNYLTPQVKAAIFEAMAKIPGVVVLPDLVDLAGRHGVGIGMGHLDPSHPAAGRTAASTEDAPIFDPTTYAFLGSGHTARLRQAVVDQPGQQP